MGIDNQIILSLTVYKIVSLGVGTGFCYMGYRLFLAGITGNAGTLTGELSQGKFSLTNAAPGTFFSFFGAVIVAFTIYKGLDFENASKYGPLVLPEPQTTTQTNENPSLPDHPPL